MGQVAHLQGLQGDLQWPGWGSPVSFRSLSFALYSFHQDLQPMVKASLVVLVLLTLQISFAVDGDMAAEALPSSGWVQHLEAHKAEMAAIKTAAHTAAGHAQLSKNALETSQKTPKASGGECGPSHGQVKHYRMMTASTM